MCMCVYQYMCMCVCAQRQTSNVLVTPSHIFLSQCLSLNLELVDLLGWLASKLKN